MSCEPTVLLVAGEASGDLHAGALATELSRLRPGWRLLGMGGARMRAAGVEVRYPLTDLAVMGFAEVVSHLGGLRRAWRAALELLDRERPEAVVLVDYPGFNLRLAREAKRRGARTVYYISPQVWAWKPGRVRMVRAWVDRMLVILPFEIEWYARHGVAAVFVGHPLLDHIDALPRGPGVGAPARVALMPGSRASDWSRLYPALIGAAALIARQAPETRFCLPLADTARVEWLRKVPGADSVALELVDAGYRTRAACDIAVAKSGTATLEHALLGLPTVIVYRTSALTYALARRLVTVPHIGMVNLIAGKTVCPELIQHDASPERIAAEVISLLRDDERREAMRAEMLRVRDALGGAGASARAAAEVVKALED